MISINDKIWRTIKQTIEAYKLLKKNDKIIIGFSGGPDSVALFLVLLHFKKEYNLKLYLAHVNHNLRGEDSVKDQEFAVQLAKKYNTPIKVKSIDIPELKKRNKHLSIEQIAHNKRYEFFNAFIKKIRFNKIALGHNLDDNMEYYFLKTFNGGTLHSLSGIKPCENNIIRPLSYCEKRDLENFVISLGERFCIDQSNRDNNIPRNWIRNKMIPYIVKNYHPITHSMTQVFDNLYWENDFIEQYVASFFNKVVFHDNFYSAYFKIDKSFFYHPAFIRRLLQKIFFNLDIKYNYSYINDITEYILNKDCPSQRADSLFVWRYHSFILFTKKKYCKMFKFNDISISDQINIENTVLNVKLKEIKKTEYKLDKNALFFDIEKINQINIRQKKIGDYIILMNTDFRVKLKKFLTDCRIPVPLKNMVPVIEINNEVAGLFLNLFPVCLTNRIHDKYKVTHKTKSILKVEFEQKL